MAGSGTAQGILKCGTAQGILICSQLQFFRPLRRNWESNRPHHSWLRILTILYETMKISETFC